MITTVKNEIWDKTFRVGSQSITVNCKFRITGEIISTPIGRELESIKIEIEEMECNQFYWHGIDIWSLNDDDWEFVKAIMDGTRDAIKQHIMSDIRFYFLDECD